jgi:hypothetical protein
MCVFMELVFYLSFMAMLLIPVALQCFMFNQISLKFFIIFFQALMVAAP